MQLRLPLSNSVKITVSTSVTAEARLYDTSCEILFTQTGYGLTQGNHAFSCVITKSPLYSTIMQGSNNTQFNFNAGPQQPQRRSYNDFMLAQELMHRFKSKSDFMSYFKESRK